MKNKLGFYFLLVIMLLITMYGAVAANWQMNTKTTTSNYSGTQGFADFTYEYYTTSFNNMSVYASGCGSGTGKPCWTETGASETNPTINNRTDFSPYNETAFKYIYWHPDTSQMAVIRFKPTIVNETTFNLNVSFFAFSGSVNMSIRKNTLAGTEIYQGVLSGGITDTRTYNVSLTPGESLIFVLDSNGAITGDSSGVLFNISSNQGIPDTPANFTIKANDNFNNGSISNFSVQVTSNEGSTNYTTTTGTATTDLLVNYTHLVNISYFNAFITTGTFENITYTNVNISSQFTGNLTRVAPITPSTSINANNFFTANNLSNVNQYSAPTILFNATLTDDALLYAYQLNITRGTTSVYNITNKTLTGKTATITHNLSVVNWAEGEYIIQLIVADGHTANKIPDYKVTTKKSSITFKTENDNNIKVETQNPATITAVKYDDRYRFTMNFDDGLTTTRVFRVKTDKCELDYLENSPYKAHFVSMCDGTGNWIDFVGAGGSYVVEKLDDYDYRVTMQNVPPIVTFDSIGSLNIYETNYSWYKGNITTLTYTFPVGEPGNATINFTKNSDYIDNIVAFVYASNVSGNNHQNNYSSSVVYQNNYSVPGTAGNYQLRWEVFIYQLVNGSTANYSFNYSLTKNAYDFGITTCTGTNASTLNITYWHEVNVAYELNATNKFEIATWINNVSNKKFFNGTLSQAHLHSLCLYPIYESINANVYMEYTNHPFSGLDTNNTNKYISFNQTFTNTTTFLSLYNYNTTIGLSTLKLTIRNDTDYNTLPNVVVKLQRRYVGENLYRTIQYDYSDEFGLTIFEIQEKDVEYKLIYVDNQNNILKTSANVKFLCENGLCDVTQLVRPYTSETTTRVVSATNSFNNQTKILSTNWTITDGENGVMTYLVYANPYSNKRLVCNETAVASSGTFSCNMTGYTGSALVVLDLQGASWKFSEIINIIRVGLRDILDQGDSAFIVIAILLVVGMAGLVSPVATIIMGVFALIMMSILGVFTGLTAGFLVVAVVISLLIALQVRQ